MTTQLDFSVGVGKETTYGTAVAPTRFVESEAKFKYDVKTVVSKGLRPTKGVARLNRKSTTHFEGSGEVAFDAPTRGLGLFLEAVLGSVTSTLVPSSTPSLYQQVHTLTKTDPLNSYTIQEVLPFLGGGAGQPHTFKGCVAQSLDIEAKEGDFVSTKFAFTARQLDTSVAATATSYPTDDGLFTFVHGAIGMAGTLTAPTTTALASLSGSPSVNIADFSLSLKNNLDSGGWNFGGAGVRSRKPALGARDISGKFTAEYTDNTLRDAYLAQTALPLVLTFTHDVSTGTGGPAILQIVIPAIALQGEVPTSNGGDVIKQSIDFTVYDNGTAAEPIYIVYRTLDTAVS